MVRAELDDPRAVRAELEPLELTESPGAKLFLHKAWRAGEARVEVACFTREIPIWIEGLESVALSGMSGIARRHLALDRLTPEPPRSITNGIEQGFVGQAPGRAVEGSHLLGFLEPHVLIGCTRACIGESSECSALMDHVDLEVALVAREPSRVEELVAMGLEHPRHVATGAFVLVLAAVGLLLYRRPR